MGVYTYVCAVLACVCAGQRLTSGIFSSIFLPFLLLNLDLAVWGRSRCMPLCSVFTVSKPSTGFIHGAISPFVSVNMCVHVHTLCTCVCVWRLRLTLGVFLSRFHLIFETGSLTDLGILAGQRASGIHMCLESQHWRWKCAVVSGFHLTAGVRTQVLVVVQQALHQLSQLAALHTVIVSAVDGFPQQPSLYTAF